jgi:predicted outer membrane repeat protein
MAFENNSAQTGGAISIKCSSYDGCDNQIKNSTFINNAAVEQGGAIYYNYRRPKLEDIVYSSNRATYGPDIASYPVRIALRSKIESGIILSECCQVGVVYDEVY